MILVALAVVVSTAFGVVYERRADRASVAARGALRLMLYVLVPFVSFVNVAHLRLTVGGGAGLAFAYLAIGAAGLAAWAVGRWAMRLPAPTLGALICSVILVNTGYLGLPMTVALLGAKNLGSAVAYDQVVSGPILFVFGFAVGAAFGAQAGESGLMRFRAFLTRNPPLLAVVAGLLAPASAAPAPLVRTSHLVVAALLPLGFFAVGVNLSSERREEGASLLERPDQRVLLAVGLRLFAAPLILAGVSATVVALPSAYLLQAAMPAAISSLIVGQAYGLDQRLIATVIVWSTATVLLVGVATAAI